jgi:hypothetical protein
LLFDVFRVSARQYDSVNSRMNARGLIILSVLLFEHLTDSAKVITATIKIAASGAFRFRADSKVCYHIVIPIAINIVSASYSILANVVTRPMWDTGYEMQ